MKTELIYDLNTWAILPVIAFDVKEREIIVAFLCFGIIFKFNNKTH